MIGGCVVVTGARQHNLRDVSITLPRAKLVVFTGPSGSGKSSLAFDTIYAEGQRRYVESLSAYARQFLGLMEKPEVDHIEGLSPAISIDQKGVSRNPRSTVATVTEIYDYLRLLFARVGVPHCPHCAALARPNILMFNDGDWTADRAEEQQRRYGAVAGDDAEGVMAQLLHDRDLVGGHGPEAVIGMVTATGWFRTVAVAA